MAGSGSSGDEVRVVTDVALLLWNGPMRMLDETRFWREQLKSPSEDEQSLKSQMVIALTNCFVLQ